MNKKIFIIILIIISVPLLGTLYVKYNYDSSLLNSVKKIIPNNLKSFLKKNVFYKNELEKQLKIQEFSYKKLEKTYENTKYNLIQLQQKQSSVNTQNLPFTQFLQIYVNEINLDIKKIKPTDSEDVYRHSKKVNSFYIESDDKNIYLFFKNGDISFLKISDINSEKIDRNFKNIKSNLPDFIKVKDTLLENNQLYIVLSDSSSKCQTMKILTADLNTEYLNFDTFFSLENVDYCDDSKENENFKFKKGFLMEEELR